MNQDKEEMVEQNESWDSERLDSENQTLYVQTDEEYDQILSRAQMSVVDDMDIRTSIRICGPSGCGKTTLASSLAIDVQIVNELVNNKNLPVWNMTLNELALFHDIVSKADKEDIGNGGCLDQFQDVDDTHQELRNRGVLGSDGEKTDDYPHSRAEMYRSLYRRYCELPYPSTPYFEVTMSHAKYAKDLIGHPHVNENGSTFIKGKVTKAVEASNETPTVLNLDEINRAPTSAKDELYDALDGRVKVSMDEVGGLEIEGTPENLIIVSTMNKGPGHHVESLDFAEKRRLRSTYYVDFLGLEYPEMEKELVVENTEISYRLASEMVNVANEIRKTAGNNDTVLSYGLPTGTLLEWADESFTNYLGGIDEPVIKGGESAVANAIYDHSEDEVTEINTIISKNMQSVEFFRGRKKSGEESGEENVNEGNSASLNDTKFICKDEYDEKCTYSVRKSEAPIEVVEFLACPECNSPVQVRKPSQ